MESSSPPSRSESISSSLLQHARTGDQDAWIRLIRMFQPTVEGWLRRWGVADRDVPDVAQEVFTKVYLGLGGFDRDRPNGTFRGWIWRIARNAANYHFQKRGPQLLTSDALQAIPDSPDDPLPLDEQIVLLHRILELISHDFEERTVVIFRQNVLEGKLVEEIAAEYGMKKSAIRESKRRVMRRLREEFACLVGQLTWSLPVVSDSSDE